MPRPALHCFESGGLHYAMDPETCFCFECDAISRDVLAHYPGVPVNKIATELAHAYPRQEIEEVVGELEWLRGAKSILQTPRLADLEKIYGGSAALSKLSCAWPCHADADRAFQLLLGRSGGERQLTFEFVAEGKLADKAGMLACAVAWEEAARIAGKKLATWLRVSGLEGFMPHGPLDIVVPLQPQSQLEGLEKALASRSLQTLAKWSSEHQAKVVLRPTKANFSDAAATLRAAGFGHVELDADAPFLAGKDTKPAEVFASLRANAQYYAEALLKRDLFRLDPIAGLFLRIYQGTPLRRADPAGSQTLHVDREGDIYPSLAFARLCALKLGNTQSGAFDENLLALFENLGSATTAPCTVCWARNLCGGGSAAVHHVLTGSIRTPHPDWSEAQRHWLEGAIAAFNKLSAAGINFAQVHENMGRKPKMSLWQAAKAVLNAPLGLRPLAEADAPMLAKWQNWNPAAYYSCHESSLLTTTVYDREMDAVHPHGFEQEFIVTNTQGEPRGLLRIRPMLMPGLATAWLYLRKPEDYTAPPMRKGFRNLLKLLPQQQELRRLLVPAGPMDAGLAPFLRAAGFEPAGTQREAIYLHGAWHPVDWYSLQLDKAA